MENQTLSNESCGEASIESIEEMLLGWARAGTASHVEKLVRKIRRADPVRENDRAQEQQESRRLVTWFDSDGMLVVQGRLSPDQGALLMKALEVSTDELTAAANVSAEPSAATTDLSQTTGDQLRADALTRVKPTRPDAARRGCRTDYGWFSVRMRMERAGTEMPAPPLTWVWVTCSV
jgi:hypothetical protein